MNYCLLEENLKSVTGKRDNDDEVPIKLWLCFENENLAW